MNTPPNIHNYSFSIWRKQDTFLKIFQDFKYLTCMAYFWWSISKWIKCHKTWILEKVFNNRQILEKPKLHSVGIRSRYRGAGPSLWKDQESWNGRNDSLVLLESGNLPMNLEAVNLFLKDAEEHPTVSSCQVTLTFAFFVLFFCSLSQSLQGALRWHAFTCHGNRSNCKLSFKIYPFLWLWIKSQTS